MTVALVYWAQSRDGRSVDLEAAPHVRGGAQNLGIQASKRAFVAAVRGVCPWDSPRTNAGAPAVALSM